MNATELKQRLLPLREHEKQFYQYFLQYPKAYREQNGGWKDFQRICCAEYGEIESFPAVCGGFMGPELSESDCFPSASNEVNVILHDRFFPPYRQRVGFLKILYCLCGKTTFYSGESRATLSAGDFVMVPPGTEHAVCAASTDALALNLIIKKSTFGSAFASLLAGKDLISDFFWQMLYCKNGAAVLLFRCGNDERIADLVVRLYEETVCEPRPNDVLVKGVVILFFGTVIKYYAQNVAQLGEKQPEAKVFPAMIRYVMDNYQSVTLASLAEHFHRSEGYVSRYIHAETGMTFRFLLRKFRLERAAEMLRNSECTVEEIVSAIGYTEACSFYRNFKERFGMTPLAYRRYSDILK